MLQGLEFFRFGGAHGGETVGDAAIEFSKGVFVIRESVLVEADLVSIREFGFVAFKSDPFRKRVGIGEEILRGFSRLRRWVAVSGGPMAIM